MDAMIAAELDITIEHVLDTFAATGSTLGNRRRPARLRGDDEPCGSHVPPWVHRTGHQTMNEFRTDLQRALDDPTRMAGFKHDHVAPFDDAIGELSTWYAFAEKRREDERRRAERALFPEPSPPLRADRDPFRHVGRNAPCPCGSGTKFRKCCLQ